MGGGYIFLMVATGITGFANFVALCIAVSDRQEERAQFLTIVLIVFTIVFLISGFKGFQT